MCALLYFRTSVAHSSNKRGKKNCLKEEEEPTKQITSKASGFVVHVDWYFIGYFSFR